MEKSSAYLEQLASIRKLPQDSESEKELKQEKAKLFRMEVMLDNAKCIKILTEALIKNPALSEDDLKRMIQQDFLLAHPEDLEQFIYEIKSTKNRVDSMVDHLSRLGVHGAPRFFRFLIAVKGGGLLDRNESTSIEIDTSYPFALVVYVHKQEHFKKICDSKNVMGFYQREFNYCHDDTGSIDFPLIVINGKRFHSEDGLRYLLHEQGHAENGILRTTLDLEMGAQININELEQSWIHDQAAAKSSNDWRAVMKYAMNMAKDELLAEYGMRSKNIADHFKALGNRSLGSHYNVFSSLGFSKGLEAGFNQEYSHMLGKSYQAFSKIVDAYDSFFINMDKRQELFRFVLAQIPFDKWSVQLESSLFIKEAEDLNKLSDIVSRNLVDRDSYFMTDFIITFKKYLNEGLPLLKLIEEFNDRYELPTQPEQS